MAYTPTQWSPGDSITSAKLNKIENGIADNNGGIFWVTGTISEESSSGGTRGSVASDSSSSSTPLITLNKTAREIIEAGESKIVVIKVQPTSSYLMMEYYCGYGYSDNTYFLFTTLDISEPSFYATSLDDYPINQASSSDSGGTNVK